ncbi:hypothetical protein Cni_G24633 [Canna indica]|uniref:Uncharacterized protein n=1 Tax=Canna indica TaxID=4628 RepID=A0AAQ3KVG2_9LILI|nr:hypothetical protein Cni_G24633 [Canna indica]
MHALRFKACRLLLGNVQNGELSLIQRRILRRLRNKRRPIKRNLSLRENLNNNIKSQTTRKVAPLLWGFTHKGDAQRKRTNFIYPFSTQSRNKIGRDFDYNSFEDLMHKSYMDGQRKANPVSKIRQKALSAIFQF